MPEKPTLRRAKQAKREDKAPTTQAGEFIREEIHHIREGKHGARSTKQAIAIGLSKARRAGVKLPAPEPGEASKETRKTARRDLRAGRAGPAKRTSPRRSRAAIKALRREPHKVVSKQALAEHAHETARKRGPRKRSAQAKKAARTRQRS